MSLVSLELPLIKLSFENLLILPIFTCLVVKLFYSRTGVSNPVLGVRKSSLVFLLVLCMSLVSSIFLNMSLVYFNLIVLKNVFFAYVLHTCWKNTQYLDLKRNFLKLAIIITIAIFMFQISISGIDYRSKSELAAAGVNPNAKLNALALLVIIAQLHERNEGKKLFFASGNASFAIMSLLLNSRQNFVVFTLLTMNAIKKYKIVAIAISSLVWYLFSEQILRSFQYLFKAIKLLLEFEVNSATRFFWLHETYINVTDDWLFPQFIHPIDNTLGTFLLQFGLFPGLILIVIILTCIYNLAKQHLMLSFGFLMLLLLQDLQTEVTFWFIVFLLSENRKRYKNV